jgi:hypothetical protein
MDIFAPPANCVNEQLDMFTPPVFVAVVVEWARPLTMTGPWRKGVKNLST